MKVMWVHPLRTEEEVEEDPEVKKLVEDKGITQEDLDNLMSIIG